MDQLKTETTKKGHYGEFGGQYIPETLMNELTKIEKTYDELKDDADFRNELHTLLRDYANRPSCSTTQRT